MPDQRRREAQHQRRRARMTAELGAAVTPAARLAVAVDYLRAAAHRHPGRAERPVDELVRLLIAAGDRLYEGKP
ncbi:hypothetical protein [Marinactinospora rubrisoli]|uniref:Uncharacterized protein n=1 Tax=Marinactinospora rubrisoli TaxID=2715399 RepID=A0ABW2KNC2_9ACTN